MNTSSELINAEKGDEENKAYKEKTMSHQYIYITSQTSVWSTGCCT